MINSVFRTGNNYYPQVLLEECKHVGKEKKLPEYITDDIEIFSDDSDREDSNEEKSGGKFLMKKILMKKIKYRMCLFLYLKHFE